MIESIVQNFLLKKMTVPVLMEEPEEKPEKYIVLEKTGGGGENGIKTATMTIQSYGTSLWEAAQLNEEMKKAMEEIDDQDPVSKATLNSDYNYTDTSTKRYRYQAVYDFVYY